MGDGFENEEMVEYEWRDSGIGWVYRQKREEQVIKCGRNEVVIVEGCDEEMRKKKE